VVVVPQYYPCPPCGGVGVEPGAVAGRGGVGTLLGPEGSGTPVGGGALSLRASLGAGARFVWAVVLGGFVV